MHQDMNKFTVLTTMHFSPRNTSLNRKVEINTFKINFRSVFHIFNIAIFNVLILGYYTTMLMN